MALVYLMRFDMRTPEGGASTTELYRTALEMAEYGESHGAFTTVLCEHHGLADGYLPAPMTLATAMAARTSALPINISVLQLPLYDPVRLAEEMCVLDIISGGRVSYTTAIGYRPDEYEMYGVDFHRRGKIAEEKLGVLLAAKTGEPFEHEGRHIHVTPAPVTPGGPTISWGGGSLPAARRAGRHGIGFFGQKEDPALAEAYEAEARAHGHEPGFCYLPPRDSATTVFVADDVDEGWDELGSYLMYDVLSYAEWNGGDTDVTSTSAATTAEELRAENRSHRILTVDEAVASIQGGRPLALHPLVGGLPPELAWKYLKVVGEKVMPALGN
ncbi:LLM class flavin-dependent oxidoreductase [Rhabdothermincola sp. EGI L10124]|nr:LLM class flavin-dependent oxidoreductase [Rhabdothermincola salaria]MCD9624290.1 LLM class flavin-dependent oxidoreductase [Rhabdothermincola salaria]